MYRKGFETVEDGIAKHGQPFSLAELIREAAGVDLHQAGGGLGQSVDQADYGRAGN